jgi:outer membrane autotransporter protein
MVAAVILPTAASAQLVELTTTNSATSGNFDDLERAAAAANEGVFFALEPVCRGGVGPNCSTEQYGVYGETAKLMATAAELLKQAPPDDNFGSLGLNPQGVGDALRGTAAEEVSAKSRASTDFSNGQLKSVANRITALRYGARGFSIAGLDGLPTRGMPGIPEGTVLGAAGDPDPGSQTLSKLGGFVNGSYGWGTHDPTTFEDAFDYESIDVTAGADYRLRDDLVLGLTAGYAQNKVDFDAIVDGGIDALGFSVGTFGLYTWKDFYVSGFFSYQRMSFDIDRFITYPSLNPNVPGVDTSTKGKTHSNAYTGTANLGYTYRFGFDTFSWTTGKPFLVEPYGRLEYMSIDFDSYTERDNKAGDFFALRVDQQRVQSLELSPGLRLAAAFSLPFGVVFPYARGEWRFELDDKNRETTSQYSVPGLQTAIPFLLNSSKIDSNYVSLTGGIQTILRGGRTRFLGGAVGDRLSLFVEYQTYLALDNVDSSAVNAGLRYLF